MTIATQIKGQKHESDAPPVEGNACMVLDSVEYEPNSRADKIVEKRSQQYCGVHARKSDGITCLAIRPPTGGRIHNIEVGQLHAITIRGTRHVLQTPWDRWRLRTQEVVRLIEGRFSEDWAHEYFDPRSAKFFARAGDYEPVIDTRKRSVDKKPTEEFSCGSLALGLIALLSLWYFLSR